jgi:hypothetical protein
MSHGVSLPLSPFLPLRADPGFPETGDSTANIYTQVRQHKLSSRLMSFLGCDVRPISSVCA